MDLESLFEPLDLEPLTLFQVCFSWEPETGSEIRDLAWKRHFLKCLYGRRHKVAHVHTSSSSTLMI